MFVLEAGGASECEGSMLPASTRGAPATEDD